MLVGVLFSEMNRSELAELQKVVCFMNRSSDDCADLGLVLRMRRLISVFSADVNAVDYRHICNIAHDKECSRFFFLKAPITPRMQLSDDDIDVSLVLESKNGTRKLPKKTC